MPGSQLTVPDPGAAVVFHTTRAPAAQPQFSNYNNLHIMPPQMLTAPPLPAPQPTTSPRPEPKRSTHGTLWHFAEECLTQTAAALRDASAAKPSELAQAIDATREAHAAGKPADLLEELVRLRGHAGELFSHAILDLGDKVADALALHQPIIPFAGKLIAPSIFYDSFDHLHKIAMTLLTPVIYAEDTDAIGTGSINPVASALFAEEIGHAVYKRFGVRPFITATRLDYESWTFLSRKHFEL